MSQSKAILDVGQCQPDHGAISQMIKAHFDADVEYASGIQTALEQLSERAYDLVLVNRIIDGTHDEGVDLIRRMKESPFLEKIPAMLISNFDSAQNEARQAGGLQGFGKADLDDPGTIDCLAAVLGPTLQSS